MSPKTDKKNQTYIFFGKSGSGKGTQANLLKHDLEAEGRSVLHIETGSRFREFMHQGSYTASLVKEELDNGKLLPVNMPIWIWTQVFIDKYNGTEDLILDGLCRRTKEAEVLDKALGFYGQLNPIVIYINVSDDWAFERMKSRNRPDDTDEYIRSRLDWFEWQVVPAMAFFKENEHYTFLTINGEQTIAEVHREILQAIKDIPSL